MSASIVFLKVLDYYTGILLLTTNRAGALDEAFKSRIHFKIYYPPLDRQQTLEIWDINVERLHRMEQGQSGVRGGLSALMEIPERAEILRFAAAQFDRFDRQRREGALLNQWSGRQIRNAFQVARSLAYSDAHTEAEVRRKSLGNQSDAIRLRPKLKIRHFELMSEITAEFDAYMREVFNGQDDADLQRELEHRADHFVPTLIDPPSRHVLREPYAQPIYDGYRGGGEPAGLQSGLGTSWNRPTSSFANAEWASSPANPWDPRSKYRGPAPDEEPLRQRPSVIDTGSRFSREPIRPVDRYGGDEGEAGMSSSNPPQAFGADPFGRVDDKTDLLSSQSARTASREYAYSVRGRVGITDGGPSEEPEYSDTKNQHGKRGRDTGLSD